MLYADTHHIHIHQCKNHGEYIDILEQIFSLNLFYFLMCIFILLLGYYYYYHISCINYNSLTLSLGAVFFIHSSLLSFTFDHLMAISMKLSYSI